jgi:hypothetical protein
MTEILQGVAWGLVGVFAGGFAFCMIQLAKSLIAYRRWRRKMLRSDKADP